ncbi:MAG: TIGR01777 family oxidoreductase [Bacteroidetes bacterium]|nr:TIGR01777 family oxidoreductase [Bacteroidota bacterium]
MESGKKVLIAGGSGLIGNHLAQKLREKHYHVSILTRKKNKDSVFEQFTWDINKGYIQDQAFDRTDYLINLAGTGIADARWTKQQKQKIRDSRLVSSKLLFEYIRNLKHKPKAFITASAVGYYGSITSEHIFNETDQVGVDFLADVCKKWEDASLKFESLGVRTVILRTGVVFDKTQGAFPKMTQSLKYGFVAGIGSGKQYIPWIHIDDLISMYHYSIENEKIRGIYNAVSPEHCNQDELTKRIKIITKKIKFPNLPGILLKVFFGEMSSILLNGSRITSGKIIKTGFKFKFEKIEDALLVLLKKNI